MQDWKEVNAENPLVYMLWSSLFLRFVTVEDEVGSLIMTWETNSCQASVPVVMESKFKLLLFCSLYAPTE